MIRGYSSQLSGILPAYPKVCGNLFKAKCQYTHLLKCCPRFSKKMFQFTFASLFTSDFSS